MNRIEQCLSYYAYTSEEDWKEYDELKRLAEITRAMRKLNIEQGYMTAEELEIAEHHALEYYRKSEVEDDTIRKSN